MKRGGRIARHKPLARVGKRGSILKELDDLLRDVVLRRDGFRCLKCGAETKPGRGGGLQAAHIFPKGSYPAMRYELDNVICLCARCHIFGPQAWHKHPIAALDWVRAHFGEARLNHLGELARLRKSRPRDHALIRMYLQHCLGELLRTSPC